MKLVLKDTILSVDDIRSVFLNTIYNESKQVKKKLYQQDWGIFYKGYFKVRTFLLGPLYETVIVKEKAWLIKMQYKGEDKKDWDYKCEYGDLFSAKQGFEEIVTKLPDLDWKKVNRAIMTE